MPRLPPALLLVAASVARYAGQSAVLVVVVRAAGAGAAGRYAVALAATAPAFLAVDLGLRTLRVTLRSPIPDRRYTGLRAVMSFGALAAITAVTALTARGALALIVAVSLQKVFDGFADLRSGALQAEGRYRTIATLAAMTAAGQIIAAAATAATGAGTSTIIVASAVAYGLVLALGGVVARPGVSAPPTGRTWRRDWAELLRAGVPAGVSLGVVTLMSTTPQYALGATRPPAEASRFAVLLYVVVAVQIVANALTQAWIPRARRLLERGELTAGAAVAVSSRWCLVTAFTAAVLASASALILPVVLGPAYRLGLAEGLPLLVAGAALPFALLGPTVLSVANRYLSSLSATAVALAVGAVLAMVLVPAGGVIGALWSYAGTLVARGMLAVVALPRETSAGAAAAA